MISTLIITMMLNAKNVCSSYLVAEDPWPYAQETTDDLLIWVEQECIDPIHKELSYRAKSSMLSIDQIERFQEACI